MSRPRRAEVWWADVPPPVGRRPVLVLTRDRAIAALSNVTVAPLTRTVRGIPTEVPLQPRHGLPTSCAASLDNLQTIPKSVLDRRITRLDPPTMSAVAQAVRVALELV